MGLLQGSLVPSELVSAASEGGTPEACAPLSAEQTVSSDAGSAALDVIVLLARWPEADSCSGRRSLRARPCPKMLSGHSTCLFSGLCAALLAVALTYYFYW